MPSSIRAFAINSEGASTAPSDGRRAPGGALLPASPENGIAPAKPALGAGGRARPWYLDVWVQILRRKPLGTVGGVIVVVMLAGAVLADVISPYGYAQTSLRERFVAMSGQHWLGTDQLERAVDAWMAFPPLLLLMSIMSLLGPSALNITIVLGLAFGIQNSRIVRAVAMSIKEHTFVESARALGSGHV